MSKAVEFIYGSMAPRAPCFDVKIEFHWIVQSPWDLGQNGAGVRGERSGAWDHTLFFYSLKLDSVDLLVLY